MVFVKFDIWFIYVSYRIKNRAYLLGTVWWNMFFKNNIIVN